MSTERPETIELGSNIVAGTNPSAIVNSVDTMMDKHGSGFKWKHPYGEKVSEKMVGIMTGYRPKHFIDEMREEIVDERTRMHFASSVSGK
jgi:UDP-N-acetylglucosamine 2-epimerase (non-hydrolysing)